jgi:hypothetical protein
VGEEYQEGLERERWEREIGSETKNKEREKEVVDVGKKERRHSGREGQRGRGRGIETMSLEEETLGGGGGGGGEREMGGGREREGGMRKKNIWMERE